MDDGGKHRRIPPYEPLRQERERNLYRRSDDDERWIWPKLTGLSFGERKRKARLKWPTRSIKGRLTSLREDDNNDGLMRRRQIDSTIRAVSS